MRTIKARKLLKYDPDDLWDLIFGSDIIVEFDDGKLHMTATEVILSSYCWLYHVAFNDLPLLKRHTIKSYYKDGVPTRAMHLKLMNELYSMVLDHTGQSHPSRTFQYVKGAFMTNNKLYNKAYYSTARYIISVSVMDDIELVKNKTLHELKYDLLDRDINEEIVSDTINKATKLLTSDLKNDKGEINVWSWLATRSLVKSKQLMQNVFMRGYITDTDGFVIDYPILDSYITGMRTFRSYNIVARENAVAVEAQQDELRRASSDSRRMTYAASYKKGIVYEDCGSTDYISYDVSDKAHLNILAGTYMFNEDLGRLQRVERSHTHLIGKIVKVRSQLTCKVHDPSVSCSVCVGALSESIPLGVNFGSDISRTIHQIIIQSKLSTKHYLDSSAGNVGAMDATFLKYFRETPAREIYLKDSQVKRAKRILFKIPAVNTNILTVYDTENVHMLTLSQVSTVQHIELDITFKIKKHTVDFSMMRSGVKAMFSYRALEFLHDEFKNGFERITLKNNNIIVDMTGFDFSKPVFKRPNIAPVDKANRYLIDLYERVGLDKTVKRADDDNILETLQEIIDTSANLNMNVSLGAIETILSAYICKEGSYNLARGFEHTTHGSALRVLANRSMSLFAMLRDQRKIITSPTMHLITNRDDSVLDVIMDPVGMLKKHKVHPAQLQRDLEDK